MRELVRIAYAKVAEFQGRGLVHFHAIIRLDHASDRALCRGLRITADELCHVIQAAAAGHVATGTVVVVRSSSWRFGEQIAL